ncbi:MAG: dihydrolipoamide acetyltransferase family protein [Saccharofermentanales bacterium]
MTITVLMPRQGESVESCLLSKWYKKKGDIIKTGDIVFTYETDKSAFDYEAATDGILIDTFFEEGDTVPVLDEVCVIGDEGEDYSHSSKITRESDMVSISDVGALKPPMQNISDETKNEDSADINEKIKISPRARALADKSGVDYRNAVPTGRDGRIEEKDIISMIEKACVNSDTVKMNNDYDEVEITNIRKIIANRMMHSLSTSAQLTLNTSFDATSIMAFRKKMKEKNENLNFENITLNDIMIYAVSRTIMSFKDLNAHMIEDRILYYKNANIGIAIDTPKGLIVPTIVKANEKSLSEISKEAKKLISECQTGRINPDTLKGGSFTITNLGSLGIESFTPILNSPQVGILGVDTIMTRARETDGKYEFYPAMGLSLTFDHRVVDGAGAARFLQALKNDLEKFNG